MKQRGIASFFGGKAENPPRTVKALSVKADELHTPDKHVAPEVLKDVNTSGTKRPREVINHLFTASLQFCAHIAVEKILLLTLTNIPHKPLTALQEAPAAATEQSSKGKLKRIRKTSTAADIGSVSHAYTSA